MKYALPFMLFSIMLVLVVSACAPVAERPVTAPGFPAPMPTSPPGEERVVTLVVPTETAASSPTQAGSGLTSTPTPAGETLDLGQTPVSQSFQTLEQMGIEPATFHDRVAGFAFEYPAAWQVTELPDEQKADSQGYSTTFLSHVVQAGPKQQEGLAEGQAKIDVNTFKGIGTTNEEAVAWLKEQASQDPINPGKIIAEETWTLPSGIEAVYLVTETSEGNVAQLITVIGERVVFFSGLGDLTLFKSIAGSLRVE